MRRAKRSVHKFLWLITLALSVLQANAPKGTYSCDSIEHTATSTLAPANTTFQTPHCRQKVDNTLTVFPLLALDTTCKLPLDRHFFPRLSRTGLVLPTTKWGHHRADGERILSGQRLVSPVWMLMNAFCNITLQFFSSGRLRRWHASPPPLFFFYLIVQMVEIFCQRKQVLRWTVDWFQSLTCQLFSHSNHRSISYFPIHLHTSNCKQISMTHVYIDQNCPSPQLWQYNLEIRKM